MSHFPRLVLIVINVIALIIGAYFIGFAHDISESSSLNECLRVSPSFIRWTVGLGSTIVVIGIIGSCLHLKALECFYLFTLAITTFVFIVLCLFVWAMLPRLAAEKVYFKTAPDGVWLREYGVVAQKVLANRMDWSATKACFRKIDTCRIMNNQTEDQKVVYIDVGCCTPPNRCGLAQAPTGSWVAPPHGLNSTDAECQMWARYPSSHTVVMGAKANAAEQPQQDTTSDSVDALLEAARYDDIDDMKSIALSGVSLDSKDSEGRTALHMASANGYIDIVDYLIHSGVDVNASNTEKNTPLHWACLNGHIEVVKRLILAGASLSSLNSHERTPIDEAVSRGKMDVIDAINEAAAQAELAGIRVSGPVDLSEDQMDEVLN